MKIKNQSIGSTITKIIAMFVTILVVLFCMATTFTFGTSVVGSFMLANELGEANSALLSGVLCLLLFDISWIVGFFQFIYTAESITQKALSAFQFGICALFSLTASITSVVLLSSLSESFTPETLTVAKYIGFGAMIFAFIVSVICSTFGKLASPETAQSIRESYNRAKQLSFANQAQDYLDKQTFEQAKPLLEKQAPRLAKLRAEAIEQSFISAYSNSTDAVGADIIDTPETPKKVGFNADGSPVGKL